jgi:hypothetical protein
MLRDIRCFASVRNESVLEAAVIAPLPRIESRVCFSLANQVRRQHLEDPGMGKGLPEMLDMTRVVPNQEGLPQGAICYHFRAMGVSSCIRYRSRK